MSFQQRTTQLPSGAGHRIAGLDGLRAIAAIMVFLQHRIAFPAGGYGVRLFFVLSGYLIIGGIVRDFAAARSRPASIRRFFVNRAFRILPIYWLTLAVAALLLAIGATTAVSWKELAWHVAFAGNIYAGQVTGHWSIALSHLWSLALEEQFYLIVAPLIIFAGRRWYRVICAALICAGVVQEVHLLAFEAADIRIVTDSVIGFGTIALGGCLYGLTPKLNWMTDTCALALLTAYIAFPLVSSQSQAGPGWVDLLTLFVAAALIVAVERRPESLAVRILEAKPLALFGRVSYGFYLYHYWLTTEALSAMTMRIIDLRSASLALQTLVLFFATLTLAALSWFLIEKPMLTVRARLTDRDRTLCKMTGSPRGLPLGPFPARPSPSNRKTFPLLRRNMSLVCQNRWLILPLGADSAPD